MVKALILDFYGVIYSNFDWDAIDERVKTDRRKTVLFHRYKTLSNRGKISNDELLERVSKLAEDSKHPHKPASLPKPIVSELLTCLVKNKERLYKVAVMSNGNARDVREQLDQIGLLEHLDLLVTSSDVRHRKPDRRAYRAVIKQLDVKRDEALIVDDSPANIRSVKKYGFKVVYYQDDKSLRERLTSYVEIADC